MPINDCTHNTDPFKLVREGSSQPRRRQAALDPAYAPVDQRLPAHRMIFARAYAAYLRYVDLDNADAGNWQAFFASDVSVRLALAAVQDVAGYQSAIKEDLAYLDDIQNGGDDAGLRLRLGRIFASAATLAAQLEQLRSGLPDGQPLKGQLASLIRKQLAPAYKSLLLYQREGRLAPAPGPWLADTAPEQAILGAAHTLHDAVQLPYAADWICGDNAASWSDYLANLENPARYPDSGIYGSGATVYARANHIATHTLFKSVLDRFLKAHARVTGAAGAALEASFQQPDAHLPHYGLFLAFLRLFERLREETNTLTARHLDFYYREVLRLQEKGAEASHLHLLGELARQPPAHLLKAGTLVKAGKDATGKEAGFALLRDTVLNQGRVAALHTLYRHDGVAIEGGAGHDGGRLYAAPVSNSADGQGEPLDKDDPSWHPFHNKRYQDGVLAQIRMPQAALGFAVASHYLLLAEGQRSIDLYFTVQGPVPPGSFADDATCLLSTAEGWLEKAAVAFGDSSGQLHVQVNLGGADPAIVAYDAKVHGGRFAVALPVLQVLLKHRAGADYPYARLQDVAVNTCQLVVAVTGLKSLAVSNDYGPVDTSKPFQPFGAIPAAGSALVIGSRELFQKNLASASVQISWQSTPAPYGTTPKINVDFLSAGSWSASGITAAAVTSTAIALNAGLGLAVLDAPDPSPQEHYSNASRQGYLRLKLDNSFGQAAYQTDLVKYLSEGGTNPGAPPPPPVMAALTVNYTAQQSIALNSASATGFDTRKGRYYHVAPFGVAEQHPLLNSAGKVWLMPQFAFQSADSGTASGAEFYIGVAGLQPPQNLSLLFEVLPGTADPLALKPVPHIRWSWLRQNEWQDFAPNEVGDGTSGLLASGIVTLSVPRAASTVHTLLAPGLHWFRLAVASKTDAVCRLLLVAAQAMEARFQDRGNDPAYTATPLPAGAATRLDVPDAAVKQLVQPFASFGGRGAEAPSDFYVRVSERLRHKDRAIALWDIEQLILEAFPQVYQARCLNHTQYQPDDSGGGIYRELAPGHFTVVTIPSQLSQNLRDPLRPYTSLDLLQRIEAYIRQRSSCFARLHVRNPQFEEVRTAFKLKLHDGYDQAFHVKLLQEELTRFLSPWAFAGGGTPTFGGKVYKSVLINFVEERPYVDYVTDFQLFHDIAGVQGTVDLNEIGGSLAVSILVSARAPRHAITVLHPQAAAGAAETCPCEAA